MIENANDKNDPFYNGNEITKLLGISKSTFMRWLKDGLPRATEGDGASIYKMSDIREWAKSKKSDPAKKGRQPILKTFFLRFGATEVAK